MKKAKATQREPSAASLREMPELEELSGRGDRGRYHKKASAAGGYYDGPDGTRWVPLKPGRPKTGAESEATAPRSVRFPASLWKRLDAEAKKRGTTRHALLRELVAEWLERAA